MSEQELKNLIVVYQQKLNESMSQNIALEARLMNANQIIEVLNKKVTEFSSESLNKKTNKKTEDFTWINKNKPNIYFGFYGLYHQWEVECQIQI